MAVGDVYLDNGLDPNDVASCDHFHIQLCAPIAGGFVIIAKTCTIDSESMFDAFPCLGEVYKMKATASEFPYRVAIEMTDQKILALNYANIQVGKRVVFSLPSVKGINDCVKKSRNVMGVKKHFL